MIVACVVGDGEAETGPLATSWHSNKFLYPVRDGAVLPILHLNGYKIANPTVLARIPHESSTQLFAATATRRISSKARPRTMHQLMAATLEAVVSDIRRIQEDARRDGFSKRPDLADDHHAHAERLDLSQGDRRQAGRGLLALAPGADERDASHPEHVRILETWMKSYRPEELFDDNGRLVAGTRRSSRRQASRRMSANPHANGGELLRELRLPNFCDYAVDVPAPGASTAEATRVMGLFSTRCDEAQP